MAGKAKATPPELVGELVYLLPEEIELDEDTNVRPFSSDPTEHETDAITTLAETIEEEGQTQAVEVRKVKGKFLLVDGRRRREAILIINAGKDAGEEPTKVKCVVEEGMGDAKAFRHALLANIHREDFTPMDFAADIKAIRARFPEAKGRTGTKFVADFLKVSPAQVTTHEKLLSLPKDIQAKIHSGELSAAAGFELSNVKPDERKKILAAAEKQQKTAEAKAKDTGKTARKTSGTKASTVRKAARESGTAVKAKARTRREILDFFELRDAPDWGDDGSVTREFLRILTTEYATGKCKDSVMEKAFDAMIEAAMKYEASRKKTATAKAAEKKAA